ncbi:pentatricopeptide repeat-containing protein DOT4, chloroplastic-like [Malania oleifera]|uniref:pentatricopeptide repeat-containing protein DOT4, chloroplastic-like n=1 Tax=Malania oleifera TaxID=397392 RepID=UPI0025AE4D8A|nr:pentatricopeptide repeat-containing protein DOT4, chloroplastic-like [Malania oleifera]
MRFAFSSFPYSASPSSSAIVPTLLFATHNLKPHFHRFTHSISSFLLLHSCEDIRTLKKVHSSLIVSSGRYPQSIASKLVTLYARFDDLESAISVFKDLREPDTNAWNAIIKSHVDLGLFDSAMFLYREMRELGVEHDSFTFPVINKAVSSLQSCAGNGEMVHCVAVRMGFGSDIYFCNTMIEVYVKSGLLSYARKVFDEMSARDLVSWTSIISGYVCEGSVSSAFVLFNEMRREYEPNHVTLIIMLQGCSASRIVLEGRELHGYVIKKGMLFNGSVQNSILQMYSKTGSVKEMEIFFGEMGRKDVISWNILISFYSLRGNAVKVAKRFNHMCGHLAPSAETLTLVISAFSDSANLLEGQKLHCFAIKTGIYDGILQTSLLDCYAKCGQLELSAKIFGEISCRNSIAWSAMMSGFTQNGYFTEAIAFFQQMQTVGFEPGIEILRSLIDACASLGALQLGKEIHGCITRKLYCIVDNSAPVETSILNLYIRCGCMTSARFFFDRMIIKDVVTWTSMIEGCATHGLGFEALELFERMLDEGVLPNRVTFLSLLSACSHSGLVSHGSEIFYSMIWKFGIEPDLDHYTCIVDLLGRSGNLIEALAIIVKMVALPDSRIWGALLASSRVSGNNKVGQYAAQKLFELEPDNTGYRVILSNMQATVDRWGEVEQLRKTVNEKDLKKKPGWSCIEAKGGMHGFVSGDTSHPQVAEIYAVLGYLSKKIHEFGCVA